MLPKPTPLNKKKAKDMIPEDQLMSWIKENVDGGDFVADDDFFSGGWEWGTDVEVLEDVD